jgi:leucyl-tRNA synthetase
MSLMYQSGQNQLARNADYATKFNTNLAAYNQAVTNQYQADTNSTGQKLYNDIQSMSDMLQQLQQSAGQLGTSSQQAVQAQITHLQNQIADYNQAANQQNASLTNLANVAKGILSGGGAVASAIVPHI